MPDTTRKTESVKICVTDIVRNNEQSFRGLLNLILAVSDAVAEQRCSIVKLSVSNERDEIENPVGDIATLTFEIECPDKIERTLIVGCRQIRTPIFNTIVNEPDVSYRPIITNA